MNNLRISYVLTTYNKIESLKVVLHEILNQIDFNSEELIIVDGASKDGTNEYLDELYKLNKISTFVSESDKGEAHGFNKGILLAKGEFIKIITDDDIFNLDIVRSSVKFLENNINIDFLFSNGYTLDVFDGIDRYHLHDYTEDFIKWKEKNQAFSFCGLGLLLRKRSLPLIGLFNTNYIRVDAEYSFRNSINGSNIGFLASPSWVRVSNPLSNSQKFKSKMIKEEIIFNNLYLNKKSNFLLYKFKFKNLFNCFFNSNPKNIVIFDYKLAYYNSIEFLSNVNLEFHK
jgi:glycosyltransferase involved in cell wall biosynthesis